MKSLVENIRINLCNLGLNQGLLDIIPKAQEIKEKQINWISLT